MVPSQNGAHQGCDPTPRRESMRRWGGRKRSSRVATARRRKMPRTQGQCTTGRIGCTVIAMRHLLWFSSHDSIMAAAVLYKSWLRLSNKNLVVQPNLLSVGWTTRCPPLLWPPAAQEHGPAFYHQAIRLPRCLVSQSTIRRRLGWCWTRRWRICAYIASCPVARPGRKQMGISPSSWETQHPGAPCGSRWRVWSRSA